MYHSYVLKSENNVHVLVFAVLHCMRQDSFVTVLGSLDGPSASGNSVIAPRCMFTDSGFFWRVLGILAHILSLVQPMTLPTQPSSCPDLIFY